MSIIRNTKMPRNWHELVELIKFLISFKVVRFAIVGASVAAIGGIVLIVLVQLGVDQSTSYLLQSVLSVELNFALSYIFTWKLNFFAPGKNDSGITKWLKNFGFLGLRWISFHIPRTVTVGINQLMFHFFVVVVGLPYWLVYVLNILIVAGFNYVFGNLVVFRKKNSPIDQENLEG